MDKKIIISTVVFSLLILIGAVFLISYQQQKEPPVPKEEIISPSGLHWHPHVTIVIKGKEEEITKDIGIGAIHNPVHTHDTTGTIHLEFGGLVAKDDLRLKQFFKVWSKDFNSNCIFDKCNGPEGTVKFLVNGKENKDFENYIMRDKDRIEIQYE